MLKKMLFALVPMVMVVGIAKADDDLFDSLATASIQDADIAIVESTLDIDVDGLAADAGQASEDEAVEACFRRFGYRSYGGYGGYGGGYGRSYGYNCYRPYYNHCYSSYYCYRPVTYYHYCAPVYTSYWGCY